MITNDTKTTLLALLAIGVCDALLDEKITLRKAEQLLFSPYAMRESSSLAKEIAELIHKGTELDDIRSLIPSDYKPTVEKIRNLAVACLAGMEDEIKSSEDHWMKLLITVNDGLVA